MNFISYLIFMFIYVSNCQVIYKPVDVKPSLMKNYEVDNKKQEERIFSIDLSEDEPQGKISLN